jgi:hypothetical protein
MAIPAWRADLSTGTHGQPGDIRKHAAELPVLELTEASQAEHVLELSAAMDAADK